MKLLVFALVAVTAASSSVFAADPLDALVRPEHATLRTEIARGSDAASRCDMDHDFDPAAEKVCIDDAQARNRQATGSGSEAFDTGLYFRAWTNFYAMARSTNGGATPMDFGRAQNDEQLYWNHYILARSKLGLRDDAVLSAVNMGGPIKGMIADEERRSGD